ELGMLNSISDLMKAEEWRNPQLFMSGAEKREKRVRPVQNAEKGQTPIQLLNAEVPFGSDPFSASVFCVVGRASRLLPLAKVVNSFTFGGKGHISGQPSSNTAALIMVK